MALTSETTFAARAGTAFLAPFLVDVAQGANCGLREEEAI